MLNHKGTVVLNTERLLLRPFSIEDALDVFEYSSDEMVAKYIPRKAIKTKQEAIDKCTAKEEKYKHLDYYNWAIVVKDTNKVIGNIKLVSYDFQKEFMEPGYSIGSKHWGKGYTTEALKEVINFFFFEVGFNRIEATHQLENIGSGKVMQKCGMKYEGMLRGRALTNEQKYVDCAMYAILKSDFKKSEQRSNALDKSI